MFGKIDSYVKAFSTLRADRNQQRCGPSPPSTGPHKPFLLLSILYAHRCAMCGIRMLTPDGHTTVDAAHIIPWHRSNNDHPTNGLALCRMCHWAFDEGLMGVGKKYEVLVSSQVKKEHNLPGHMLALSDRPMFRPEEVRFWPDQESCGVA